jgi:hypothetical protein
MKSRVQLFSAKARASKSYFMRESSLIGLVCPKISDYQSQKE